MGVVDNVLSIQILPLHFSHTDGSFFLYTHIKSKNILKSPFLTTVTEISARTKNIVVKNKLWRVISVKKKFLMKNFKIILKAFFCLKLNETFKLKKFKALINIRTKFSRSNFLISKNGR